MTTKQQNTDLMVSEKPVKEFLFQKAMVDSLKDYALQDYNQTAFLKSAMLAIVQSTDLRDCLNTVEGKMSLIDSLRYAATTGLSLNPQEGKACLIPYNGKVTYQIMKNGLTDLLMATGKVKGVVTFEVHKNDEYSGINHKPGTDDYSYQSSKIGKGEVIGYHAAIIFNDGTCRAEYMEKWEVFEHRNKYAKGLTWNYDDKNGKFKKGDLKEGHAWVKSFDGMALKTVLKKLCRQIKIAEPITAAVIADDNFEGQTYNYDDVSEKGHNAESVIDKIKTESAKEKTKAPEPVKGKAETGKQEKDLF